MRVTGRFLSLGTVVLAAAVEKRDSTEVISKTICYWDRPQSALIRDTIYLDGGLIGGQETLKGGVVQPYQESLSQYQSLLYEIDLRQPFTQDFIRGNVSRVIQESYRSEENPQVRFGHMLANDYEFILYGGVMDESDSIVYPDANWALAKDLYPNNGISLPASGRWRKVQLDGVTRYIADGAYVNVPSENLSFVFGGSRGENWGEIRGNGPRKEHGPSKLSSQLISVDLKNMGSETWENRTLPKAIPPRTGGEIVWLPTGQRGALLAFGGTAMDLNTSTTSDPAVWASITDAKRATLKEQGQKFMQEVHVYDIANNKWYTQQTDGDIPPPTAEFCSVVASSQDQASHQIYMYGGYAGVPSDTALFTDNYDQVYVLSIPSFKWTKVYAGNSDLSRRSHRCHKISYNRLMVVGGVGRGSSCLSDEFLRVFNLNTLQFEEEYNPENQSQYKVPKIITDQIGGTENGGATLQANWNDSSLPNLLMLKYPGNVTNYWPFISLPASNTNVSTPTASAIPMNTGGLPGYVPPLLGSTFGLLILFTILCGVLFWLRRRKQRLRRLASDSGASTVIRKHRTWSWLMNVNIGDKEDYYHPGSEGKNQLDDGALPGIPTYEESRLVEAPEDTVIHEMPDTGVIGELAALAKDRKVTYVDQIEEISNGSASSPQSQPQPQPSPPPPPSPPSPPSPQSQPASSPSPSPPSSQSPPTASSRPLTNDSILSVVSPMSSKEK